MITRLLESIIADPKVKLNDLLIGDKNAIMIGTRILGYGKDYNIVLTDPDTQEQVEYAVDLTKLENKPIDKKFMKMVIVLHLNYQIQKELLDLSY